MILALVISIVSAIFYYVNAFKTGLSAKRWAVAGLIMGPFLLPMFSIKQRVALRKSTGFGSIYLQA